MSEKGFGGDGSGSAAKANQCAVRFQDMRRYAIAAKA